MRRKNHDTFSMDCSLLFRSAYDNSMHTIFTHTFASCLDYIYYLSDGHTLIQVFPTNHKCFALNLFCLFLDGAIAHDGCTKRAHGNSVDKISIRSFGGGG